MKLSGRVTVVNRSAISLGMIDEQRFRNAVLAIMRPPGEKVAYILLITFKNKKGTRYRIRGNIERVYDQFRHEGKTTISFKQPPHDLMINTDEVQLANFMQYVKKAYNNEIKNVPEISNRTIPTITPLSRKTMEIKTKSEYPIIEGFPSYLEMLTITTCCLKRVDNRILKLKSLTVLCLDKNNLTEIPTELNKLKLRQLSLSYNKLGNNPQCWNFLSWPLSEHLEYLNLSGNAMKYFPASLARFHALRTLKLSNISVNRIPFRIFLLPNLQELSISKNSLTALPGTVTTRSRIFSKLDISNNEFLDSEFRQHFSSVKKMPNDFVPSLLELSLRATLYNGIYYDERILPRQLISALDNMKLCICGEICANDFGPIYRALYTRELATLFISSQHMYTIPIVYQACCPQHLNL